MRNILLALACSALLLSQQLSQCRADTCILVVANGISRYCADPVSFSSAGNDTTCASAWRSDPQCTTPAPSPTPSLNCTDTFLGGTLRYAHTDWGEGHTPATAWWMQGWRVECG